MKKKYCAAVIMGGGLWGLIGLFGRLYSMQGISKLGAIIIRNGSSALFFLLVILFNDSSSLRIRIKDLWGFTFLALSGTVIYHFFYYCAISVSSLAMVSVFIASAPIFIVILSFFIFKEPLTKSKLIAMPLCVAGCTLASGLSGDMNISLLGIIYSVCAAVSYGAFGIISRIMMNKGYSANTVNFYNCVCAAIICCFLADTPETIRIILSSFSNVLMGIASGFLTCFLADLLYLYGLSGVDTGKASIMASSEMIVTTLIGVFIFHEKLGPLTVTGMILVILGVYIINRPVNTAVNKNHFSDLFQRIRHYIGRKI